MRYLFCLCVAGLFACSQKAPEQLQNKQISTLPASDTAASPVADAVPAAERESTARIISLSGAGPVTKGMHARMLYELYDSTLIRKSGLQTNQRVYTVFEKGTVKPVMVCRATSSDTIIGIEIQATDFRTEKAIGVGNSFADLARSYHIAEVYADQNSRVFVRVEELQQIKYNSGSEKYEFVEFEIGFSPEGATDEKSNIPASAIPPDVKIISIVL